MSSTAYATARPRYGLLDIVGLLFRELLPMILVFVLIFALGTAAVLTLKKTYTATGKVYAGVGQEYVYQPRVGTAERGQAPDADAVAQSEAAILNSLEVKQRTVAAVGVESFLGSKPSSETAAKRQTDALKVLDAGLGVGTTPGSAIIGISYESDNPQTAARVLNAVIAEYLTYRREVFQDTKTPAIEQQRQVFEDELATADSAYEAFLTSNDIGDFATLKATLAATYQTVFTEQLSVRAQLDQARQRLTTLVAQQAAIPAEVTLQQDLNISAQDQVLQLRTQREQLLSRYRPDAQPVKDIEEQIAQLQAFVGTGTAVGAKEVRTGPNPIWVQIEGDRIAAAAEAASLGARLAALDRQVGELRSRQTLLTQIESTNATLAGDREVLTANIRDFQERATQSRADSALVMAGADNVTVIERAQAPTRGKSLKAPLLIVVFLFAGFTALCVGLLRIFTRRRFATAGSIGRTLEMPVLAVAPMKAQ